MSTKSTLAYGPTLHLYHEVFDDNNVYLELEGVPFEASYNRVMVPIPLHIWEVIRHYKGIDLNWVEQSDEELERYVIEQVDERLAQYAATSSDRRQLLNIAGGARLWDGR
jgi:hypothetical protein